MHTDTNTHAASSAEVSDNLQRRIAAGADLLSSCRGAHIKGTSQFGQLLRDLRLPALEVS